MAIKAQGQFTIIDMTDPIVSGSEPKDKVVGMLWLDTSKNPNELKRWDGENWITVSDPNIKEELEQTIQRVENAEIKLDPKKITAVVEANTTVLTSKEYIEKNYTSKEYAINNLANKSEIEVLNNNINAKVSQEEYDATIDEISGELTDFNGRLNQAEIDLKPQNITLTVEEHTTRLANKTELEGIEENAIEQVNSKIADISLSLDAINQRVEHTESGSKNYIKNSGNFKDTKNWLGDISISENNILARGEVKNSTSIPLEKNTYYTYTATIKLPTNYTVTENNLLNYSMVKKESANKKGVSGRFVDVKNGEKNIQPFSIGDVLVVQVKGDSFYIFEGLDFTLDFISNKTLTDIELSINDGETYDYIGSIAGNKVNFVTTDLKNGIYICNIKASTDTEIFTTQSFLLRVESMIVFDDNFEVMEILGTKDIRANEFTRICMRLKTRVDLEECTFSPIINPNIGSQPYYIKNIQFEKGSIPSDWIDSNELEELRKQIAEVYIGINEINSKVADIQTLTNEVGNLEQRVKMAEQKITADSITSTVMESITFGSKNYIRNSGEFSNKDFWTGNISVKNSELNCQGDVINNTQIPITKGETYVLSATVKLPSNFTMTENNLLDYIVIKTRGGELDD